MKRNSVRLNFSRLGSRLLLFVLFCALTGCGSDRINDIVDDLPAADSAWRKDAEHLRSFLLSRKSALPFEPGQISQNIAFGEFAPANGLMLSWRCNPNDQDSWRDELWMRIIAEAVKAEVRPYVYLYGHSDKFQLESVCSRRLKAFSGVRYQDVTWVTSEPVNSFWVIDYGGLVSRNVETGGLNIIDPVYYETREFDDRRPKHLAAMLRAESSDLPLRFEGGNFLSNGAGICISSTTLLLKNPEYTQDEINELFRVLLGCQKLVVVDALEDFSTGHVDMWMMWANKSTLVVGEYREEQDSVNSKIIEKNVANKLSNLAVPATGKAVTVVRIPMPSNCPAVSGVAPANCPEIDLFGRVWRTYTNVLTLNGTVLLPAYRQDSKYEYEARSVWEALGFNVRPLEIDDLIPLNGALHCIGRTIPQ